ncbi:hypothetical protein, partial [Yersinia ruckeri]|uniref:hypothetical protein n=1 Tax=Yersinia ruckeri TaxID=29486 RepID=UPI001B7FA2AC
FMVWASAHGFITVPNCIGAFIRTFSHSATILFISGKNFDDLLFYLISNSMAQIATGNAPLF